jgi:hypothetical protein
MTYDIGIDPDSEKHGTAIYADGHLKELGNLNLIDLYLFSKDALKNGHSVIFHIENTLAISATFAKSGIANQRALSAVSRSVGMCQQAQKELVKALLTLGVEINYYPISKSWKTSAAGKAALKSATGYSGNSNEDTRSAAYFGWLGVKKWHTSKNKS